MEGWAVGRVRGEDKTAGTETRWLNAWSQGERWAGCPVRASSLEEVSSGKRKQRCVGRERKEKLGEIWKLRLPLV